MTISIVTRAVEVGQLLVLQEVLDVAHLVVHCDEVLLVHPDQNGGCANHSSQGLLTLLQLLKYSTGW